MRLPVRDLLSVFALALLVLLSWGSLQSSGQVAGTTSSVRWEYRVEESHMSPDLLNRCGKEGWELVNTLQTSNNNGIVYHFVFKRAR